MLVRMLIWAVTLGLVGAVVMDYSSYDTTLITTMKGAALGGVAGIALALIIQSRQRGRSRNSAE